MRRSLPVCVLLLLVTIFSDCKSSTKARQAREDPRASLGRQPQPVASPRALQGDCKWSTDLYARAAGGLSYAGYDIVRLKKKVRLEDIDKVVDVPYAAVTKGGRVVAKFDGGVYASMGNGTEFGLFPLLGNEQKQLLISQTVPRGGEHWIVDLNSGLRVLFYSAPYGLGGREDFCIKDIDKDGTYELSFLMTAFWGFGDMSMAESPLPEILFKYDPRTRKYLPANLIYQDYLLQGIDDEIRKLDPADKEHYLANRLGVLLRYVYAGKEKQGWDVFDREYTRPDSAQMKAKIKSVLDKEPVYKFLYRKRAT
jgi:hypothetical protein